MDGFIFTYLIYAELSSRLRAGSELPADVWHLLVKFIFNLTISYVNVFHL